MAARVKKEVAASCFDFLYIEMIQSNCSSPEHKDTRSANSALDSMGFHVGQQLVERYTLEKVRFVDHLEAIKFICRDFWSELFKKQMDNLKTNRQRDVFVLADKEFRWLSSAGLPPPPPPPSSNNNNEPAATAVTATGTHNLAQFLVFPSAIIRGALSALGVRCEVTAEVTDSTTGACAFHVRILQK